MPRIMTFYDFVGGSQSEYEKFLDEVARSVLGSLGYVVDDSGEYVLSDITDGTEQGCGGKSNAS